jgi:hypothetical protein
VSLLWAKGLNNAKDVHTEMFPVYSEKCLSHKVVHIWVEKFSPGRSKVADAQPGRPVEIATKATVQWVEKLIRASEEDNNRQCSNCTRVFQWFSIQHNA